MNYYQRNIYCDKNLNIIKNFENKFQILPSNKIVKYPSYNVITLEYDYDFFLDYHYRTHDRSPQLVSFVHNEIFSSEILSLLTLGTNGLFLIRNINTPRNRYPEVSKEINNLSNELPKSENAKKENKSLEIFPKFDKVLIKLYSLPKKELIIIKSAIYWFYNGSIIGREISDYNSQFISYVNSIEALCKIEFDKKPELCDSCGQTKFKITKKFIDFLVKYSNVDQSKTKKKDLYRKIYNKRSDLIHKGELFVPGIEGFINTSIFQDIILLEELQKAAKEAILNFILSLN